MLHRLKLRVVQVAVVSAVLLIAFVGLSLWNKSDYCQGWAAHYLQRSVEREVDMLRAVADHRQEDATALARAVRTDSLIAQKYLLVSKNPLLPYPKYPLITEIELDAAPIPVSRMQHTKVK